VWIKRGSFVVVDTSALADRENKLDGEIVNVVRDEKDWRKMAYWYV
jgi:probable RNA-binding protein EIF1AD